MSNTWDLQRLQKNREEILKAELFMLLHDVGKLQPGHQAKFIRGYKPPHFATKYKHDEHILQHPVWKSSDLKLEENIQLNKNSVKLQDIINKHHGATERDDGLWIVLAQRIDRLDSRWDRDDIIGTFVQPVKDFIEIDSFVAFSRRAYKRVNNPSDIQCSKTFKPWPLYYVGPTNFKDQENDCLNKAFCCLIQHIKPNLEEMTIYHTNKLIICLTMQIACGDTRFSVNDITLWEHSISTAILYKSLTAWAIGSQPNLLSKNFPRSNDDRFQKWFHPQLLPLRIDGLAYLAQSNNVPDLLARRARLQKVYDTWQDILEWEFPLAGEVYRDENGPVFLTFLRDKDGKNAISLQDLKLPQVKDDPLLPDAYGCSETLNEYLYQTIIYLTQGDLTLPKNLELITYTQERSQKKQEKSLGDLLRDEYKKGLWLQADAQCLEHSWQKVSQKSAKNEEVCAVCGLRPQGFGRWYAVEISEKEEELLEEQEKALREWLRHYQNEHRPQRRWEEKTEEERKCQVCKAISRSMCGVCFQRREARAKPWVQGIHLDAKERFLQGYPETVWLDEVADENGRLALIVGYFPLENWLDGTLIESLAMFKNDEAKSEPPNREITVYDENGESVDVVLGPKPISYSRIRRVWETTRRFWQDVAPTDVPPQVLQIFLQENEYGLTLEDLWEGPLSLEASLAGQTIKEKRPRIFLKGTPDPQNALGPYHAYELEIQGRKVAVLWVPEKDDEVDIPEEYRGGFWVIENLNYLKSDQIFGRDVQEILKEKATYKVYEPTEYGRPGREQAIFTLDRILHAPNPYTPLIPILAEPRTFMALVPANKAFQVVKAIKTKYEVEMGRVRNRLPLHLGIVFADSHQPLRTILDAGRRMLKQKAKPIIWKVICSARKQIEKYDSLPDRFNCDRKGFSEWFEILLETDGRQLTWFVPAVMGDGQTEDHWYPYVYLATSDEPIDRRRYYKTDLGNPWNPDHPWLVHAAELEPGDIIYFTPATFDFLWLGHGGDRFRLAYDKEDRRLGTLHHPYLLDELEELGRCWHLLKEGLSSNQLHQVRDLIEGKRAEWFENPENSVQDPTFRNFCEDVLRNAEWTDEPTKAELKSLTQWAVNGLLADAVELFYHIMKERPLKDDQG